MEAEALNKLRTMIVDPDTRMIVARNFFGDKENKPSEYR
jgi:hypothetical protein